MRRKDSQRSESNPFVIAVLAGKYANEAKNDDEKRYRFKRNLFRMILKRFEFPQADQRAYLSALIYFIDYLLKIPIDLTQKLRTGIILTREEIDMMYIDRKNPPPTFGEVKKEWLEEGKKQVALEMLKDGMPVDRVARYVLLPIEVVKKLTDTRD